MIKYNCEYLGKERLNIGDKWQMKIEAANPKEAYEKFIEKVGRYPEKVIVDIWWGLHCKIFDDHIEAAKLRILVKGKAEGDQRESQKTKEFEQNENLSTDELLIKIIENQERNINNQNEQTEALGKIRWAIIGLGFFIIGTTMLLKMKWGL